MKKLLSILVVFGVLAGAKFVHVYSVHAQMLQAIVGNTPSKYAITSYTPSTLRNNYTGTVGFRFQPLTAIVITSLCRWTVAGNTQTHTVYLYNVTTATVAASASINSALGTAGTFQCVAITPVTLIPYPDVYAIGSCETNGGDQWYDLSAGNAILNNAFGTLFQNAILNSSGCAATEGTSGSNGTSYVPVNMTMQ